MSLVPYMLALQQNYRTSWCRKILSSALLLSLLSVLASCATLGPDYQPPQVKLPTTWSDKVSDQTPLADEALAHWWTLFDDPLLDSLVQRALVANQDIKIAAARVLQARAQYRLAGASTSPSLNASGGYSNSRRSANAGGDGKAENLFEAGFDADWELDIFGAGRRSTEAASARLSAAEENDRDVRLSLAAEVARNYLELRSSQQQLATGRENILVLMKTLELVKGREEFGLGNRLEVFQAETSLSLAQAQLSPLETSIGQATYRLALLLGLAPLDLQAELSSPVPLAVLQALLPESLPSDLLRRRPDIRSVERLLAAATADIGVATAELFPHFSLTGLIGLQSRGLGDLLSSGSRYWTAGSTVQWSLFNSGQVRANIDLQQARREEAQALYEKTVLTALNEVETTLLNLVHEADMRLALTRAVTSGEQAVEFSTQRYRAGLTGFLDVLLSERTLYQSRQLLILSEQRLNLNLVALYKALGGGWQIDPVPPTDISPTVKPLAMGSIKE